MSNKILATVGALGNPTRFHLTPGLAHDLCDSDELIPHLEADIPVADKAYNATDRLIDVLQNARKQTVIPSKSSSLEPREYNR